MKYRDEINTIIMSYKKLLGERLVGIYLHGSLAMGCFTENSDIDLLVVVDKPIENEIAREMIDVVLNITNIPKKGIEMSVVLECYCLEFEYPTPFELHYGESHRKRYLDDKDYICGGFTDEDLAAHFVVTKHRGICLYGKPIDKIFLDVSQEDYWKSIMYDISDAEDAIGNDTVYHVLNLCRAWAYHEDKIVLSKLEGGNWALDNVNDDYKGLIVEAIEIYKCESDSCVFDKDLLNKFVEETYNKINLQKIKDN